MTDRDDNTTDGSLSLTDAVLHPVCVAIVPTEVPLHDGPGIDRYPIVIDPTPPAAKHRGDVDVVEHLFSLGLGLSLPGTAHPYPFDRDRRGRMTIRRSVWDDEAVAGLRRRGLVFTGAEFERRLAKIDRTFRRRATEAMDD